MPRPRKYEIPSCVLPLEGSQGFQCTICRKRFRTRAHAQYHRFCLEPHAPKPFQCDQCSKTFICKSHFLYHMKHHTGEGYFECSDCGQKFKQSGKLKRHRDTVHLKLKPFSCSFCSKTFSSKQLLRNHMFVHTGESRYRCKYCARLFSCSANLRKHEKRHTTNEKRYLCEKCGKTFSTSWSLQMHTRAHNGFRVPCGICQKTFTSNKDLRRHRISVHDDKKPYKCPACDRKFNRLDHSKRHYTICVPNGPPVPDVMFRCPAETMQPERASVIKFVGSAQSNSRQVDKLPTMEVLEDHDDPLPFAIVATSSLRQDNANME